VLSESTGATLPLPLPLMVIYTPVSKNEYSEFDISGSLTCSLIPQGGITGNIRFESRPRLPDGLTEDLGGLNKSLQLNTGKVP
jgi:hypothetical protein